METGKSMPASWRGLDPHPYFAVGSWRWRKRFDSSRFC